MEWKADRYDRGKWRWELVVWAPDVVIAAEDNGYQAKVYPAGGNEPGLVGTLSGDSNMGGATIQNLLYQLEDRWILWFHQFDRLMRNARKAGRRPDDGDEV
jgi:hypothetical protein